ncbi:D-alanyl-D-alanine carboxypeptidase/D-alanyl-D-alanine-endopeptidase (penicillin-binding protein 4) [Lewinella aquimaris]|uniref:D-alanyl-D-alanine carboxypeptidase/D-alanyl-D-alanine-endopeptidase (Penicillin-binding protein 4) n=1 Tax=Neolewinella aquimaris TaxID=1835722 RepID=A0A840E6E4_9BACT|nr:D-alanyl-D-alanine carboxypeptidase [Neolewinella aquimaris]MBB4078767.1 D-alanyl-D-alanine carboxypeptidase/D-alanyl-D-alanine-endopeptidase (penicillin-binding protein 4) [Neolewinella aquimaris]
MDRNPVFSTGHTGFCIYDVAGDTVVYAYNADRYFVPASNVKLLTFYLSWRILADRAPAVFYRHYADRTEVWGSGYPLLLHPEFGAYDELSPWLTAQQRPLVLNFPTTEQPPRYGAGWSWDDYEYGYVYERSSFPVYGNRLYLDLTPLDASGESHLYGSPPAVASALLQDSDQERTISRSEGSNLFTVGETFYNPANFPLQRALVLSPELTTDLVAQALPQQSVGIGNRPLPPTGQYQRLEVSLPDTVYRKLLQDSDNYLAEQLIIQCAADRYGTPDEERLLDFATDTLFAEMKLGRMRYADGSGLSRYNLLQPRQLARIVLALDESVGRERLLNLLPAGGVNGTLTKRFADRPETYVWAKTGSLSGVVCLSGLVRTRTGRWLAFSFLHNNVVGRSSEYYREMERVLGWAYDHM